MRAPFSDRGAVFGGAGVVLDARDCASATLVGRAVLRVARVVIAAKLVGHSATAAPTLRAIMATLSEADSKRLLAHHGVPLPDERTVPSATEAAEAASQIGFPVVLKLCGDAIAHKTERGLVKLNLRDIEAVQAAGDELLAAATPQDGKVELLVAPMIKGNPNSSRACSATNSLGRASCSVWAVCLPKQSKTWSFG